MLIDIISVILLVFAVIKGVSKGFVVAVFSFLSVLVGLAAALKLSATVAGYARTHMQIDGYWLPLLSFAIVFAGVVFLVRWGAIVIKKMASLVLLGWIDMLAGILLYAIMFLMVYSIVLFYATGLHLISAETQLASKTYAYIEPLGPGAIKLLGKIIPFFKGMFAELSSFFERVA